MSGEHNKKDIKVLYKGVDITDDIGLCVCNNCIQHIKDAVDEQLKGGVNGKI